MVDGDRAIVLAAQGRTVEAAGFADAGAARSSARPRPGPLRRVGRGRRPSPCATTVARHAADAGDLMTAAAHAVPAPPSRAGRRPRPSTQAQLHLARGVVLAREADARPRPRPPCSRPAAAS